MNCGTMGLDWERLSLSGYLEAIVSHTADGPDKQEAEMTPRMRRFMDAHRTKGAGNA